jgi:F0F1-type ATP synthase alpha subunit
VDKIPVSEVSRFNDELVESLRAEGSILKAIDESKDLTDETLEQLKAHMESFSKSFYVEGEEGEQAASNAA